MVTVRGRLTPEAGALLMQALAAARETLYQRADGSSETPTMAQQQADALALLAESALHHGLDPGAPGERYQVVVHVDAAVLADPEQPGQSVLEDGGRVSYETSASGGRLLLHEQDLVSELFEAPDVMAADPRGVATVEVVHPEIVVGDAVPEHVPQRHEHRVLDGHDGLFRTPPGLQPMI